MTAAPSRQVRRAPRVSALGLDARWRLDDDQASWRQARLLDLSLGGALVSCGSDAGDVVPARRIVLLLERRSDNQQIELLAEVLRVIDRGTGPRRAGLRFVELGQAATQTLAAVLNEELALDDDEEDEDDGVFASATPGATIQGLPLTAIRLHDVSLYDLLDLDPACENRAIEDRCEALIALVAGELHKAVGKKESRLRVLHTSLVRMRPLWNDPIKRARYDLRWGYFRVDQRLRDAESGTGVHAHVLAGIWADLYPDLVREAEQIMKRARVDGLVPCLRQAIELDPYNRRRRQRLALLENPPEPDVDGPAMPPPGKPPMVRGSLADLPLRALLRSVAEDDEDAEIVVKVGGKAVGVVGVTRGDLVTAICGERRGVDALRVLSAIADGTFQARYAAPRIHLRHMRAPALDALDEALDSA